VTQHDILPFADEHRAWDRALLTERRAGSRVMIRGHHHQADLLPGFVAHVGDRPVGLVACHVSGDRCEIASLTSTAEEGGIGTAPATRPRPRREKGRLVTKPGPGCILRVGDSDQGRQRAAKEPPCRCRGTS
jgi:hypothetical protein